MKNIVKISLILFFLFFILFPAQADNQINLYFFYGDGCPHCVKEKKFLDNLEKNNKNIKVYHYEVWHDKENQQLLKKIIQELKLDIRGVPVLIVGEETIVGYLNDQTTGKEIQNLINNYLREGCDDLVAPIIGINSELNQCVHGCDIGDEDCMHNCGCQADKPEAKKIPDKLHLPLIGEIETKNISLPILTIVLAAIDGFNPCAMWVLLFLINLLLNMDNRRKMWILGSAFIISSAAVYFAFLAAWLNIVLFMGFANWLRITIAVVAIVSGGLHLYDWWHKRGCRVTGQEKRRVVFDKLKKIVLEDKFIIALGGIIILAAVVNLVELLCSAGIPAVYVPILTLSGLSAWQYYLYLILYIFIFLLDDLLIFIIAMKTLQVKAGSSNFTYYSALVGGLIMVILGILLIFKPGWLMFG